MIDRLVDFLGHKPKSALTIILILAVALALVSAGLALNLTHFGRAPYPSDEIIPFSLVDDKVIYTQDSTNVIGENKTPAQSFPYTGMKMLFQVDYGNGIERLPVADFGNQSHLSIGLNAVMHQVLMTTSTLNVSIDITDTTGDGSFDQGDTIVFDIVPLKEGYVFTFGLLWVSMDDHGAMILEDSFAIDDGKLYAWFSHALDDTPWYQPYWPAP